MKQFLYIALAIVVLSSCSEENTLERTIDVELQSYFESFQKEALDRGVTLDMADEHINGYISNIPEDGIVGNCTRYQSGKKELTIDASHWKSATHLEKEFVVFHELGHCILGREHLETKDHRGFCVSMMASGKGSCRLNYKSANRASYLDELFK